MLIFQVGFRSIIEGCLAFFNYNYFSIKIWRIKKSLIFLVYDDLIKFINISLHTVITWNRISLAPLTQHTRVQCAPGSICSIHRLPQGAVHYFCLCDVTFLSPKEGRPAFTHLMSLSPSAFTLSSYFPRKEKVLGAGVNK